MKTRKSISKRFKITKNGKVFRRAIGQDHFQAKKSGKQKRRSKRWIRVAKVDVRKIMSLLH